MGKGFRLGRLALEQEALLLAIVRAARPIIERDLQSGAALDEVVDYTNRLIHGTAIVLLERGRDTGRGRDDAQAGTSKPA
jgi:hypothetical protein